MSATCLAVLTSCTKPPTQKATHADTGRAPKAQRDTIPRFTSSELLGRFDPATHPGFSRVPNAWTDKQNIYMRSEVLEAYRQMREAALREGVTLVVRSATRNFDYQRGIWERKWERPQYMGWRAVDKARDILTYSAMPGASRHHWGTDIDFNAFENDWFESGEGATIYEWLCKNASDYGFHQVYDDKSTGRTGYELERWHWSFLPTADLMLAAYNEKILEDSLTGAQFSGSETADSLNVLRDFVNGLALPQSSTER